MQTLTIAEDVRGVAAQLPTLERHLAGAARASLATEPQKFIELAKALQTVQGQFQDRLSGPSAQAAMVGTPYLEATRTLPRNVSTLVGDSSDLLATARHFERVGPGAAGYQTNDLARRSPSFLKGLKEHTGLISDGIDPYAQRPLRIDFRPPGGSPELSDQFGTWRAGVFMTPPGSSPKR